MKALILMLCFTASVWHGKREMLTREAERLEAVFAKFSVMPADPAEGVSIPIETFEDGSVKLEVRAERGKFFLKEGLIYAEGVVIVKFGEDREEVSRIEAERCIIDRTTKSGWVEGPAKITQGKTVFSGRNMYFSSEEGYVASMKDSEIFSTDMKIGGAL